MVGNERVETIELKAEELKISKREVERGRVVVRTRVEEREELAEAALRQQGVRSSGFRAVSWSRRCRRCARMTAS